MRILLDLSCREINGSLEKCMQFPIVNIKCQIYATVALEGWEERELIIAFHVALPPSEVGVVSRNFTRYFHTSCTLIFTS